MEFSAHLASQCEMKLKKNSKQKKSTTFRSTLSENRCETILILHVDWQEVRVAKPQSRFFPIFDTMSTNVAQIKFRKLAPKNVHNSNIIPPNCDGRHKSDISSIFSENRMKGRSISIGKKHGNNRFFKYWPHDSCELVKLLFLWSIFKMIYYVEGHCCFFIRICDTR